MAVMWLSAPAVVVLERALRVAGRDDVSGVDVDRLGYWMFWDFTSQALSLQ